MTFGDTGPTGHAATASDGTGRDTGLLNAGESATFTFDQPGTYTYPCTPHPFMVGRMLVADASGNVPDAGPRASPAPCIRRRESPENVATLT
jgi:Copper binding proteins, plastocyanin/azurin family